MIEIKLSQGAKPGHGGILPGHKVSAEIAATRACARARTASRRPPQRLPHPVELMQFVARLRELSGGKPVGFKFCLGHPWEFMGIAKAMLATGITPDFIVDGKEGGTGAAPREFTDNMGVPLRDGLMFVHNTLVGLNLRERKRIGAAGKIVSAFDIASVLAIGADWVNSARGFMFAIGCIQSQSCHQQMPDRRGHPRPAAPARAGGAGQGRAGRELPPQHLARPGRNAGRRRAGSPVRAQAQAPGTAYQPQ
jgi:glutamate synthase domain-containing protein 2